MNQTVAPGNDFFAYVNGGWVKSTEIPPDRATWGSFQALDEQATQRTRGILDELVARAAQKGPALSAEERKLADFFATFLDEAGCDKKGLAPLQKTLSRYQAIKDKKELARLLGEELRTDVDPLNSTHFHTTRLFGLWVGPNFSEPSEHAPYLLQGGLGMPDRQYYLDKSPKMTELRAKYQAHIAAVLGLAGMKDSAAKAARIVELETKMAQSHASREESEDVLRANNPWPRSEFATRAPGLDWNAFFTGAGLGKAKTIIVWHPSAARGLSALVKSEPLEVLADWLAYHAIERRSQLLPRAFFDEHFAFFGKTLSGTLRPTDRWKRAVGATNAALGDAVGRLYVERYFPADSKAKVLAMVQNIRAAFSARIDKLDWMAQATKEKAKEKLGTLYVGIGYPERFIDYSGLQVVRGDAVGNAERAELFAYRRDLGKLGKPVDKTEWAMTPQTVNALNLPLQNALNFPAAIMAPPFFDPAAPPAANYGAIGAVIGHEISHSFDDQGAQFDAQGKLADWWTKEDRAHFQKAGEKLAAQFDAYKPLPDLHVNGKLTLSENIADLAGLAATYDAWRRSLGGGAAPVVKGLSGEQQLFWAYARVWRTKLREPALRQQIITNGHAPAEYRADTVRNLDAWYSAFSATPGQALYLPPSERVRVW